MKSIFNALRKSARQPVPAEIMAEVAQIKEYEFIPLDIYGDLPPIGEDRLEIMGMIRKAFPDTVISNHELTKANRRKLYMSIHFLRTQSKRQWVYDVYVNKGQFTTDSLIRVASAQRKSVH